LLHDFCFYVYTPATCWLLCKFSEVHEQLVLLKRNLHILPVGITSKENSCELEFTWY